MYIYIKRLVDIILSFFGLVILAPVVLLIIMLIKIESKGPTLFTQRRIGQNKREFLIYKFRTMRIDTPSEIPTHLLKNPEQFITKIGKFLRKSSLDELPQLINIIKGDMTIVGPRPALWNQYDLIELRDKNGANKMMPGITGLAQVMGRDELSIFEKSKYDGIYAKRMSLNLDIKIIKKTIKDVLRGNGVVEGKTV